ncbi:hypothetical protein PybrP1_010597 [[Pythium] brassicae (nom. inval.)]|nr:hypothetical protein PybrP1_010597 [[Pythium] brassicae (nom. inval.)]
MVGIKSLLAAVVAPIAVAFAAPDSGPNVLIFDPSMPSSQIQPGQYQNNIQVGFYTQVLGLGQLPGDVHITGNVISEPYLPNNDGLQNFWRGVENFAVTPTTADRNMQWAVQSGSQQQWFSRNSNFGSWNGAVWNMAFVGIGSGLPDGTWPKIPNTIVDTAPVVREKPFLTIDSAGNYSVNGVVVNGNGVTIYGLFTPTNANVNFHHMVTVNLTPRGAIERIINDAGDSTAPGVVVNTPRYDDYPPPGSCQIENGVVYTGNDLQSVANITRATDCCSACSGVSDAAAFTWKENVCYCKSGKGSTIASANLVSGTFPAAPGTCTLSVGIDIALNDVGSTPAGTARDCCTCAFMLLLGWLKTLSDDVNVPSGWGDSVPSDADAAVGPAYNLYDPFGTFHPGIYPLPKFTMTESSLTGLLMALGLWSLSDTDGAPSLSKTLRPQQFAACARDVVGRGAVSTDAASPHRIPDTCAGKLSPFKIAVVPDTAFTRAYFLQITDAASLSLQAPSFRESVQIFQGTRALDAYVQSSAYDDGPAHPRIYAALVFDEFPSDDAVGDFATVEYTVRLNATHGSHGEQGRVPRTIGNPPALSPFQRSISVGAYSRYAVTGFMTLQTLVTRFVTCMPTDELDARLLSMLDNDALIKSAAAFFGSVASDGRANTSVAASPSFSNLLASMPAASREALLKPLRQAPQPFLGTSVAPFPIEGYTNSPFYDSIKDIFALLFVLAYLYTVSHVLVVFIQEKESRMREFMKILGVKEKTILISWYITYTGILLVGSALQTLAGSTALFANSSLVVALFFFFLFGMSVLAFGFLVSTLFSRTRAGAFVGVIVFFLMYFVSTAFKLETSERAKTFGCILSPVALTLGVRVLANLESTGQGIAFSNIDWYFPVSPAYWFKNGSVNFQDEDKELKKALLSSIALELDPNFETVTSELREQERTGATLSVQGLHKVFAVPGDEKIKGYVNEELHAVVENQIREVGLTEKRKVKSSELSGGMKRKLSVAISLLGDSSLVFLDEPTSGMDPYSRRSTWEILLNNRNDRVMVLTTHFMDEADILGDRIAIMSEGELRCCGSSLFLKNRFGAGYNLTLVKAESGCDDNNVVAFIQTYVPDALVLSNVGSEIAFQLPLSSSSKFAKMFAELDGELASLGLLSYGVSVTTLEEVFIKVAEASDEDNQHTLAKHARGGTPAASPVSSATDAESASAQPQGLFMVHLKALLLKRFNVARRDKKMQFYSTALPVLLLLAGLLLLKSNTFTKNDPKLSLTSNAFSKGADSPTPFYCQADSGANWCSSAMSPAFFSGALPQQIPQSVIPQPAFDSNSPTMFGVTYTNPAVNASDATGYGLRLGEEAYKRGYGVGQDAVTGQYGAFLVHGESDKNLFGYNLFVNTTATHGAVIFKALMDQAIYRFFASNASSASPAAKVELKVNTHPLPLSKATKALFGSFIAFTACLFIVIAFTYFPASIVVFLVKEKQAEHNSKHQQLVSGVSLGAFWLANYIWDLLSYIIPFVASIVLIKVFDISSMTGASDCVTCTSQTFPAVIVIFFLFGLAICPFTYCLSYLFKEHASSQTYTIMINFIIGVVLMVVSFILDVIESTKDINAVLVFIWRLSPLFNLGNGLLNLVLNELVSILESDKDKKSPFSPDIMGFEMIFLVLTTVIFGALAVGIDYALTFPRVKNLLSRNGDSQDEAFDDDIDVQKEAQRVASGAADSDVVKLQSLRKVYKGGKAAVRNLSFGLKRGECFGFLGINGAGKTTTMKMLTGDVLPTSGGATLSGFDILTQQIEVRRQIGYCPQFDALFELLTVREHLELFARIKGVPSSELENVVSDKIEQLNLSAVQHLKSRFGDGLVFDVKLAAPSPEELQELVLQHFSDPSHAFRDGLVRAEAFLSWCVEETRFDELSSFLSESFGPENVVVMERQNDFCRFKLRGSSDQLKLSKVFALVEGVKEQMSIREYSVSQTTLEQIFNQFASQQAEEQGVARGMYKDE